jgi:hypothetical protein
MIVIGLQSLWWFQTCSEADINAQTCAGIMLDLPQGNCTELSFAVISVAQVMVVRRSETDVKHSLCSSITFVRQ